MKGIPRILSQRARNAESTSLSCYHDTPCNKQLLYKIDQFYFKSVVVEYRTGKLVPYKSHIMLSQNNVSCNMLALICILTVIISLHHHPQNYQPFSTSFFDNFLDNSFIFGICFHLTLSFKDLFHLTIGKHLSMQWLGIEQVGTTWWCSLIHIYVIICILQWQENIL